ncbi:DUF4258 domain-containing protein [Candidatus Sumerlaeota bacterium]|nr:DUF4258 domain-containing protein [Candidatus Sumerlaeota bacterium]
MKPVRFSEHAQSRLRQRGATEEEILECIHQSPRAAQHGGRFSARKIFLFGGISPVNNQQYRFKTIEPIFAEEPDEIVVVTVKVYYSNEETDS